MDRFRQILQSYVDSQGGLGVSAKITHRGRELFCGAAGYADPQTKTPFSPGAVVRIFSLSKMINAVAALKLFEQGCYTLDDPLYRFVPAFKDAVVLSYAGGDRPAVRSAKNEITMRHLFTMTAGYAYPVISATAEAPRRFMDAGAYSEKAFSRLAEQRNQGMDLTTAHMLEAIAAIPMAFEPGEGFIYGLCADILGGAAAAIAGKSLGELLRQEIFIPLGMKDTSFTLGQEQKLRLATIYDLTDPANPAPFDPDTLKSSLPKKDSPLEICIGGLYSTLEDYSRFMQMLSAGGVYAGQRILGRKTVELMTMDHLTAAQYAQFKTTRAPRGNASWGLMTRVTTSLNNSPHAFFPGSFGWAGAAGCVAIADPNEDITVTVMAQRIPADGYGLINKLSQAAYAVC
jgi:CubicO group peptidase (beta-lactamase class C family)